MKKSLGNEVDEYDLKEKFKRTLVTVNILEGLRFYVCLFVVLLSVNLNLWKVVKDYIVYCKRRAL